MARETVWENPTMSYELGVKLGVTLFYFLILIGIGVVTSRLIQNISDYFVAGKGLGYWLVSFSSRASGESGWLILGLTGMGFVAGLHAFWVTLGEVVGVLIAWLFLVQRFKLLTDEYDSITIPDYLESRFHDVTHILRIVSAIVLSVFVTMYVAGQYVAAGKAFEGFLGMNRVNGIILGMVIVIFYSVAGGFLAVAWSDLIQGILMFLGLTLVPLTAMVYLGGPVELFEGIRSIDPVLLTISGDGDPWGIPTILTILGLVSIGWGFLGSPQLFVRFIAIKNNRELINGSLVAVLFTVFTDAGAVLTGMCGRVLYENLDWISMFYGMVDEEMVYPLMIDDLFPLWISAIFLAVVLAAIMSTADSLLVVASSAVVRDIYQKIFRPGASQTWLTRLSRIVTLILSLLALWFAIDQGAPKFDVAKRNAPLNQLEYAGEVKQPNESLGVLARLDQEGLEKRWFPAVREGLNQLKTNLRNEREQLFEEKQDFIDEIEQFKLTRAREILTDSSKPGAVRKSSRSRLVTTVSDQQKRLRHLLRYSDQQAQDLSAEWDSLAEKLPALSGTQKWDVWFSLYDELKKQTLEYLNQYDSRILRKHHQEYLAILERTDQLRTRFESKSPTSISGSSIETFQAEFSKLSERARNFYPGSMLKIENQPPVFWFILIGWAGIASAFCPVIILSLYWRRMTRWGAVAGMVTAFVVVSIWVFLPMEFVLMVPGAETAIQDLGFDPAAHDTLNSILYEMVPGFVSSFIAIILVSLFTRPKEKSREDLKQVRRQSVDFWE